MSAPNQLLMEHNPLSKLPTLVVSKAGQVVKTIFDSSVICEWLDYQFKPEALVPSERDDRLHARKFEALGDGILDLLLIWLEERLRPEDQRSAVHIAAYQTKFRSALRYVETNVGSLGLRKFDVGQLAIGCALSYADFRFPFEDWRSGHCHLSDWHQSFSARQSVLDTPVSDDLDPQLVSIL